MPRLGYFETSENVHNGETATSITYEMLRVIFYGFGVAVLVYLHLGVLCVILGSILIFM